MAGRRVTGVRYRVGGELRRSQAAGEVILAAGTFGSPAILQMSGIGPAEFLSGLGVEVRHDLRGVGENLQDHWMLRVQHRLENTVTLSGWMNSAARQSSTRPAILPRPARPARAHNRHCLPFSRAPCPASTYRTYKSTCRPQATHQVGGPLHPFPGMTSSACILRPTSRGHVRIRSSSAAEPPAILHNFLGTVHDQDVAVRALELVRHIVAQPPCSAFSRRN